MCSTDTPVAVLGLGPMGRSLARALLGAGVRTTVWNRSPEKARALAAQGAAVATSPGDAIAGAEIVIACLRDYDAVLAVLPDDQDWSGRVLVNLTSGEPRQARALAADAAQRGLAYIDGAILTPATMTGTQAAAIICAGPQDAVAQARPVLAVLAGTTYLGADPGLPSAFDVALLDIFATSVAGITHAFALARAEGIAPTDFARFAGGMGAMLPPMIERFADQLEAGAFPGDVSTIGSAQTSIRHVIQAAADLGMQADALTHLSGLVARAVEAGHGDDGLGRLADLQRPRHGEAG